MSVRAKFRCIEVKHLLSGSTPAASVALEPVHGQINDPDGDNAKFYRYTPSGRAQLDILNPAAAEQFVLGAMYYLDFTPAA